MKSISFFFCCFSFSSQSLKKLPKEYFLFPALFLLSRRDDVLRSFIREGDLKWALPAGALLLHRFIDPFQVGIVAGLIPLAEGRFRGSRDDLLLALVPDRTPSLEAFGGPHGDKGPWSSDLALGRRSIEPFFLEGNLCWGVGSEIGRLEVWRIDVLTDSSQERWLADEMHLRFTSWWSMSGLRIRAAGSLEGMGPMGIARHCGSDTLVLEVDGQDGRREPIEGCPQSFSLSITSCLQRRCRVGLLTTPSEIFPL